MKPLFLTLAFGTLCTTSVFAQITMPMVVVGDAGNAADARVNVFDGTSGYGRVDYEFKIGKYEVTVAQYVAFLNAVAVTDTYGLYNQNQTNCGVIRSGVSGSYSYSVIPAFVNRPMEFVYDLNACRFANWLHNGQPSGPQGSQTTENGAYTIPPVAIFSGVVWRNPGATWALPNEDEWYKAAYYKLGSPEGGYWLYPTGTNIPPGTNPEDPNGNNANFGFIPPYATTTVGEFQNTFSPCGAFDMGGNVNEFTESAGPSGNREFRGGGYVSASWHLRADNSGIFVPANSNNGYNDLGFRVVQLVATTCLGDLNSDGFVDDADFVLFAAAYDMLDCAEATMPSGCPSDLSGDGYVDDADFVLFAAAYDALLCP